MEAFLVYMYLIRHARDTVLLLGEIPVFPRCPDVDPKETPKFGCSYCSQ